MENINIRFAKIVDMDQIVQLCKGHAAYEKSAYSEEGKKELLTKSIFQENPPLYCLVAAQDNYLLGYLTYMKQFSTWDANYYVYMDCLFMLEAARGFGIGEKLVNRMKEESRKQNCQLIQWQTPDFNERAIKFYKRIGATSKSKERFYLDSAASELK